MSHLPRLQRTKATPKRRLVHLGPGAFFRAFNAVYTDDAMSLSGEDWGITAVSLRTPLTRDLLKPQDNVYTAITKSVNEASAQVVSSICEVLHAPDDPAQVIQALLDPNVCVVSLTITEKGYGYDASSGSLNPDNPDINHDLNHLQAPRSALGFLVAALRGRRAENLPAFTILSCDNLPSNGKLTQSLVMEFASKIDQRLAAWIDKEVCFPSTMIDRITPTTSKDDIEQLGLSAGYFDPACVVHEPFRQWVVEDRFCGDRPPWELCGVQFVKSVERHEHMKLRCLNGVHSTLAYLGYLAGFETIAATCNDADFIALCKKLWSTDIIPTVPTPEGEDLEAYCRSLLTRFQNPAVRHTTWQIAMDGSQKLPQRFLGTLKDNLDEGRLPSGLILACAAWMRYVGGVDEHGQAIDVRDPLADALQSAIANANAEGTDTDSGSASLRAERTVTALLSFEQIFDSSLASNPVFRLALIDAYEGVEAIGAHAMVKRYVSE